MRAFPRILAITALLLAPAVLHGQTSADPTGHWEGTILAPGMEVRVEIDVTKNDKGELIGTFGQPAQQVTGLPLTGFAVDGRAVGFQVKGGAPGQRAFKGEISADGKMMSGDFASQFGTLPFQVTRTGDARIDPPARSAPIGKELEGTWDGTLDVDGGLQLVLTLTNENGSAIGTIVNRNEGLEIPVAAITQSDHSVTLEIKAIQGSYSGALSSDGTELVGTFKQRQGDLPLTFRRVNKS